MSSSSSSFIGLLLSVVSWCAEELVVSLVVFLLQLALILLVISFASSLCSSCYVVSVTRSSTCISSYCYRYCLRIWKKCYTMRCAKHGLLPLASPAWLSIALCPHSHIHFSSFPFLVAGLLALCHHTTLATANLCAVLWTMRHQPPYSLWGGTPRIIVPHFVTVQ